MPNWPNFQLAGDAPVKRPLNGVRTSYDIVWQKQKKADDTDDEETRRVTRVVFRLYTNTISVGGPSYIEFSVQQGTTNVVLSHGEVDDTEFSFIYDGLWTIERISTADNSNSTSVTTVTMSQTGIWQDVIA